MSDELNVQSNELPEQFYNIKDITCPNCNNTFKIPFPRYQRMRMQNSYENLRVKYEGVEPVFYEVVFCPQCGYTRLKSEFENVNDLKRKLFKEEIGNKFTPRENIVVIDAQKAIEKFKFSFITAKAMNLNASEVAMIYYKLSWIKQIIEDKEGYLNAVKNAYAWFEKALQEENFPVLSVDEDTCEYLMGVFAKDFGDYTASLKHCSKVLTSDFASDRLKERSRDLKDAVTKLKK